MLTGGSGLLGSELQKISKNIVAPTRDELDVRDESAIAHHIREFRPDIVLHAAAVTDNQKIKGDPASALDINIKGSANVVRACLGTRIRLVYLSTDYVYPGNKGHYSEDNELQPTNLYAWTKLAGEAAVRAVPNHLIIRTSFGPNIFPYPIAFSDKWSSKEYVDVIAPEVLEATVSPLTGVINIGGPRRTIYDFAVKRNRQVRSVERVDNEYDTPADTSLDLRRWRDYRNAKGVVRSVTECRICESPSLVKYLDLGMMPIANNLSDSALLALQAERFPLQLQYCNDCSLSQLTTIIDPEEMFAHYTYRSSINKGYIRHCRELADLVKEKFGVTSDDLILDIAGNDGTLLTEFKNELGVNVLNVDAAKNIAAVAEDRGIPTINEFWSMVVADRILNEYERPKLVLATNVFAHVDDLQEFLMSVKHCLDENGVLILEFPYCVDFIEQREFDTIYFEHLNYFLLWPLMKLVDQIGFRIFDVEKYDIHGGTVRLFIANIGVREINNSVANLLEREKEAGFYQAGRYLDWSQKIEESIKELANKVCTLRKNGAKIAAFAASAKGNTLLNVCGLDRRVISYIVDDTPEKIGLFSPGTGIPIVDRSVLKADPPDYLLILAWNFSREIIESTEEFSGKYIIPIPTFSVI